MEQVTPAVIAAALLSLILEWFPGLGDKWEELPAAKKTAINAALVALISIASVLGRCYWWGDVCPDSFWKAISGVLVTFLLAAAANQATYQATRREVVIS